MDSTPVIFKRKSSAVKASKRTREKSPEEYTTSGDDSREAVDETPSSLANKLKKKTQKSKTKSRLRFGGDEDEEGGEVFEVKKSSMSKKMSLRLHPATVPTTLEQATISNDVPKYDAAYLQELKASTPSARPSQPSTPDVEMSIDPGSIYTPGVDMEIDDAGIVIPSESSIKVAREKRERIRQSKATGEEDYISLSVTKREDIASGPHPESRLVREEDELGEGDDEYAEYTSAQERIALGKKSRKVETSKRRDEMKDLIADAEEEDEETVEWEQEQLRRGGLRTSETSSGVLAKPVYKPTPIPAATPVPTLAPAMSRITEQLAQLTTSHAKNSTALTTLALERQEVENRETEMRNMVEKAETKRAWFMEFKEWVESVAAFLDEKYPMLEDLEKDFLSLLKQRAEMIQKRRNQDDEDDLSAFFGSLPVTVTPDELDDYGRSLQPPDPIQQRKERRVTRTARRQLRSSKRPKHSGALPEEEGYSTDSSLAPADSNSYSAALHEIFGRKKEVLADVRAEEFRDPGKGRWNAWREQYSDTYIGAWGGLGVVSAWEFWVRLECVGWNCVEDERSLHGFKWYKGLYEYCRPGHSDTPVEERELGPDGDLVASMITTAVIPILCKILDSGALDVYSLKHIRRVIDLSEEIEASIEVGSIKFQMLLKSVMNAFEKAINETETQLARFKSTPHPLPGFNPDSISSRRRFLVRRVKLLTNLLKWYKYSRSRSEMGVLIARLVEVCIVDVCQGGWEVGGEEIAQQVAKILPADHLPFALKQLK